MSSLGQLLTMLLTMILNLYCPAVMLQGQQTVMVDPDPSYAIYQKYRYAYDTYGYLFLYHDTGGENGNTEAMMAGGGPTGVFAGLDGTGDSGGETNQTAGTEAGQNEGPGMPGTVPALAQLQDYDYLMKKFYSVHASTTAGRDVMQIESLMGTDLRLEQDSSVPQILIYHTHSQETYADYGPSNQDANIVSVGDYLTELLQQKGWNVIHDKKNYDVQGGKLDRNKAYNYALEGITGILQQYPTIQVVLDLHRDGVSEKTHLVSEVNGKQTANIMFFQGMSRTPEGAIEYLPNPYLQENLAFSFQMQYLAAGKYPGFTRKIYLKGLRYNMHLRPRSSLIEVGAQTNTLQEARNAMEPLAELLDMVLQGN